MTYFTTNDWDAQTLLSSVMADRESKRTLGGVIWKAVMVIVALWLVYWMLRAYVL